MEIGNTQKAKHYSD